MNTSTTVLPYAELTDIFEALAAPFDPLEVEWRPGRGGTKQPYLTARAVIDRLNEVLTPLGWSDQYEIIREGEKTVGIKCTLTVHINGYTVSKSDIGAPRDYGDKPNPADPYGYKSGCSDALKRAAVHLGVGTYLYYSDEVKGNAPEILTFNQSPIQAQRYAGIEKRVLVRKLMAATDYYKGYEHVQENIAKINEEFEARTDVKQARSNGQPVVNPAQYFLGAGDRLFAVLLAHAKAQKAK